jgi:hypothetical protein
MIEKLEKEIQVLLCKVQKIFALGFFKPMQHLLIDIPYEAKVDAPVESRLDGVNRQNLKIINFEHTLHLG